MRRPASPGAAAPPPPRADNLIGQLIFAPPAPPPGPGLCAPARGPRAPAGPPGLLALIRRPRRPAPAFVRAREARPPLPSRTPSARPRPLGSVHLFELHNPPAAGAGEGSRSRAGSQHPLHSAAPCVRRDSPPPQSPRHTHAHARGAQLSSAVVIKGGGTRHSSSLRNGEGS